MAQLLKIKTQLSSIWAKGCFLVTVCVFLPDLTRLTLLGVGRKSWNIVITILFFSSFNGLVVWGWGLRTDSVLILSRPCTAHSNIIIIINQLLFADDTALVADSELCRLVNEFGRLFEKRKSRVNVGKSRVMRCSRHINGGSNVCDAERRTVRGSGLF